jgi:3-methyl-2-oxobutanoate hydroxymethyltransferase
MRLRRSSASCTQASRSWRTSGSHPRAFTPWGAFEAVAEAGAYSLVLEGIPTDLAKRITDEIDIPTIGIGAGPHCDGQVLVCYDLLGLTPDLKPKFVKRYAEFFEEGVAAARRYGEEVRAGTFPGEEHSFGNVKKSETPAPASSLSLVRDARGGYGPEG